MTAKLFVEAIVKVSLGTVLLGALIFGPAGTFDYWQGWLLMIVLFVPMLIAGFVMMAKSPDLLRKRLSAKEKEDTQKAVVAISGLMFIVGFVLSGLGVRFGWYMLPDWVVIVGAVLFLLSYVLYAEVMRENAYLSRTIEVQENQKVVSTGLYGIVRHPMYMATIVLFLSMPLVLGSLYAFIVFLIYPFVIAARIKNEEEVLEKGLEGYTEYKQKVKYKILPFIW